MIATSRFLHLRSISIADALTATNIQLGIASARGLIIPISAAPSGSTISFYYRNDQHFSQNGGNILLDARAALGTLLGSFGEVPPGPGRFYTNGTDVGGYSSNVIIANTAQTEYVQFVLRFDGVPRQAGFLYLYMRDDGSESYQPLRFADVRVYDYAVSPAQISQPLLPNDYSARYTFAGYQAGDTIAQDVSGNGNLASIYY